VSVHQVMMLLRRRWMSIVAVTVLALALAAALVLTTVPVYSAGARCFVSVAAGSEGSGSIFQGSQFALTRVQSYTEVVDSPDVLEPVIKRLGLPMTSAKLAESVSAVNPANTVLINISATAGTPAQAASIANAVASEFSGFIENLETARAGGQSPVKVTVTGPAVAPTSPTSPLPRLAAALALLIGLGAGVMLALLRDKLDTSVRTAVDVRDLVGMTPLGLVPNEPQTKGRSLVMLDQQLGKGEAFRSIRTNLQFVDVDSPPRAVVITSANPAEGKTTTACNLAIALAQSGQRVCLIEADLRRPTFSGYLQIEGAVGLSNVLAQQMELDDALTIWGADGLTVLAGGTIPPDPSELLGSKRMRAVLDELKSRFEIVIIDAPPLLPVTDAAVLGQIADGVLLVVRSQKTKRDDVTEAVQRLRAASASLFGTVLTFVPKAATPYQYAYASPSPETPVRRVGRRRPWATARKGRRSRRSGGD